MSTLGTNTGTRPFLLPNPQFISAYRQKERRIHELSRSDQTHGVRAQCGRAKKPCRRVEQGRRRLIATASLCAAIDFTPPSGHASRGCRRRIRILLPEIAASTIARWTLHAEAPISLAQVSGV